MGDSLRGVSVCPRRRRAGPPCSVDGQVHPKGLYVQGGLGGGAVTVPLLIWRVRFARFWSQVATIAPWVELGDAAQSLLGELAADLPGFAIRMVNAADRLAQALRAPSLPMRVRQSGGHSLL